MTLCTCMSCLFINFILLNVQGPNHVWHLDGYDKLKPFGFPIHACIDGYVHVHTYCALHDIVIIIVIIIAAIPGNYCGWKLAVLTMTLM